jgi:hypothetical protein
VSSTHCSLFNKVKSFMKCTYSIKILACLLPFVSLSYETQFKFLSFTSSGIWCHDSWWIVTVNRNFLLPSAVSEQFWKTLLVLYRHSRAISLTLVLYIDIDIAGQSLSLLYYIDIAGQSHSSCTIHRHRHSRAISLTLVLYRHSRTVSLFLYYT